MTVGCQVFVFIRQLPGGVGDTFFWKVCLNVVECDFYGYDSALTFGFT